MVAKPLIAQILRYAKQFYQSSWLMKRHLLYSIASASITRVVVLLVPFKYYRRMFGTMIGNADFCPIASSAQLGTAVKFGRLCDRVAGKLPFNGNCMMSAATFVRYARKYDIPYLMHLGVSKKKALSQASGEAVLSTMKTAEDSRGGVDVELPLIVADSLFAHAWVRVGNLVVTGSEAVDEFTIVASFYNPKFPPNSVE